MYKQVQQFIFSCELKKSNRPFPTVNNIIVNQSKIPKRLGMFPNSKLGSKEHILNVFTGLEKKTLR